MASQSAVACLHSKPIARCRLYLSKRALVLLSKRLANGLTDTGALTLSPPQMQLVCCSSKQQRLLASAYIKTVPVGVQLGTCTRFKQVSSLGVVNTAGHAYLLHVLRRMCCYHIAEVLILTLNSPGCCLKLTFKIFKGLLHGGYATARGSSAAPSWRVLPKLVLAAWQICAAVQPCLSAAVLAAAFSSAPFGIIQS